MANITFTRPAPFGSIAIYRVVEFADGFAEKLAAWNEARKTRQTLHRLSDDVLADIGLVRADIDNM